MTAQATVLLEYEGPRRGMTVRNIERLSFIGTVYTHGVEDGARASSMGHCLDRARFE